MDRRAMLRLAAAGPFAAALGPFLALGAALAETPPAAADPAADAHARLMAIPDLHMHGREQIAMLLYPGFTALDLVGPHYMFACMMGATVHLVTPGHDLAPVASDLGLAIAPTTTLERCPKDLDILFAPGGTHGTLDAMQDRRIMAFMRDRGARAKHVTSVCTGSLILGQAGLLKGKRATSHWATLDELALFGATPVAERVVSDGNVTTGAGVSAGLDFGLALLARLRGVNYAKAIQLQAEYAPQPPFDAGTLATAPPDVASAMADMFAPFGGMVRKIAMSAK